MKAISFGLVLFACGSAAVAQDVGELKDMRKLSESAVCPAIQPGGPNLVRIGRQNTVFGAVPGTIVRVNDGIAKDSDVLARIELTEQRGTLYLVPAVDCYPELPGDRLQDSVPRSITSVYRFGTRTVTHEGAQVETLALHLDRGAIIVSWNDQRAPLAVILPFDSIDVTGTTVSIAVDAAGTSGFAFVRDGSMVVRSLRRTFTDGQTVRWGGAGARESVEGNIEPLRLTTNYYTEQAWGSSRRAGAKWGVPTLLAAAGVFAAVKLWPDSGDDDHSGTVIIRVPFRR